MARRILILDGHPDPDPARFCHALAAAYARGAARAGHAVHRLNLRSWSFRFSPTAATGSPAIPARPRPPSSRS